MSPVTKFCGEVEDVVGASLPFAAEWRRFSMIFLLSSGFAEVEEGENEDRQEEG